MKKILTAVVLATSAIAAAQQVNQQPTDDQLQQQAPRETQQRVERAAKVDAVRQQSNSEIAAEKAAKEKGQSQRQTKAQPVGINPPDEAKQKDIGKQKKIMSEDSKRRN